VTDRRSGRSGGDVLRRPSPLNALRRIGLAGSVGYILLFYSERMFWSVWRPEDGPASLLATLIVYAIAADISLAAIRWFRVRAASAMFLVGAAFGWLIEGVFAMTLFGAGGVVFPITIAWTGLAWHALISVMLGLYALPLALLHSLHRSLLVSASLGIFWGVWSVWWERQAAPVDWQRFLAHALIATLVLIPAYRAMHVLRVGRLGPSRTETALLAIPALSWFALVTVPVQGVLALIVLPVLFGAIFVALRRNRQAEIRPDFLAMIDERIPWTRSACLLVMPVLATLVHEAARNSADPPATNVLVLVVTAPLGAIAFIVSLWRCLRWHRPASPSSVDQ
jgi:hypothetical protein